MNEERNISSRTINARSLIRVLRAAEALPWHERSNALHSAVRNVSTLPAAPARFANLNELDSKFLFRQFNLKLKSRRGKN